MKTLKPLDAFITSVVVTSFIALPALGASAAEDALSLAPAKPPTAVTLPVAPRKLLKQFKKQHRHSKRSEERAGPKSNSSSDNEATTVHEGSMDATLGVNGTASSNLSAAHQITKSQKLQKKHSRIRSSNRRHIMTQTLIPAAEAYLKEGRLLDGEKELTAQLERNPGDDNLRFGLGITQFLRAVEKLCQDLYKYGLRNPADQDLRIPFLRLEVPSNHEPETMTYEKARRMMDDLNKKLLQAAKTLGEIEDPEVKVPLHFGMIKLDLDGDGKCGEGETLWQLYSHITRNTHIKPEVAEQFSIAFDRGDVHWLKGYCHLLSSFCEIYLAHDTREMFERTGHLFFTKVESPYAFLTNGKHIFTIGRSRIDIADVVSFIHLISWDVVEPERMRNALYDWEQVVAQSRISWKFIMAETDNDREWLPNPKQDCVMPNVKVTDEMVQSWGRIMDEIDLLLKGERLVPFWRNSDGGEAVDANGRRTLIPSAIGTGVNLRKVFLEPRKFDAVLWVQGTAAAPYIETGRLSKGSDWRTWSSAFGDNFPGFAIYFN